MDVKTKGIVLKIVKYNDRSNIVDLYTSEFGRCAALVNLSKSPKSKVKSNLFQPLALLDLNLSKTNKASLFRIKDVKPVHVFNSIPFHPFKSSIAFYIAEFLCFALKDEEENFSLFTYIESSLVWFDASPSSCANFHLVFLMRLSLFLGVYPNYEDYHPGQYFDLLAACFTSTKPYHANYLSAEESAAIVNLMRMNYETMHLFKFSRQDRSRVLEILNEFYKIHIPNFTDLKSLDVLKDLFE